MGGYEMWDAIRQSLYTKTIDKVKKFIEDSDGDVNKVMEFTLNEICSASHGVAATFWYYDVNGDGFIRATAVKGGADLSAIRLKIGEGIAGKVIKTGVAETLYDVHESEDWSSKTDEKTGFVTKSMLCIPLTANNYTFGCIQLINKDDDSFFDKKDFEFIQSLSNAIAEMFDEYKIFSELRNSEEGSVLYLKIDNLNEITTIVQPKEQIALMNYLLEKIYSIVYENNGFIDAFNYEGVVAYWLNRNGKTAVETIACDTAKKLIELNDEINIYVNRNFSCNVYYSVGISSGPMYKHRMGYKNINVRTIAGNPIYKAIILENNAEIGDVVVDTETAEKASEKYSFSTMSKKRGLFGMKKESQDDAYILNIESN